MTVAIIDYGSGNLRSAAKAFERMSNKDETIIVTSNPQDVLNAHHVVLPGVGAYKACRTGLADVAGMEDALQKAIIEQGKPFLGICVGMQLLATLGEEFGETAGLDWIAGRVKAIQPNDPTLKIPHMGWNKLENIQSHPVLAGLDQGAYAYFVHSFHFLPAKEQHLLATTSYGEELTAVVGRDNIIGTQFHPEKSQDTGLRLIRNFLNWKI